MEEKHTWMIVGVIYVLSFANAGLQYDAAVECGEWYTWAYVMLLFTVEPALCFFDISAVTYNNYGWFVLACTLHVLLGVCGVFINLQTTCLPRAGMLRMMSTTSGMVFNFFWPCLLVTMNCYDNYSMDTLKTKINYNEHVLNQARSYSTFK